MKQPASASMRDAAKAAVKERKGDMVEVIDQETGEVRLEPKPEAPIATRAAPALAALDDEEFFNMPELAEFDPVRQVTCPILKWQAGTVLVVQIATAIKLGKKIVQTPPKEPPHLTIVKSVKGQFRTLILGAVLKSELEENYPNDSYVSKWFAMKKLPRERFIDENGVAKEKAYSLYHLIEITDPSATLITREERAKQVAAQ